MSALFLKMLNVSITAGWLILAVLLVRLFLKKSPRWISCALWALVAIRLICPFSLKSELSLIPNTDTVPINIEMMKTPAIDSGVNIINEAVNPIIANSFTPEPLASANPLQIVIPTLSVVWIAGILALLLYSIISFAKLKKSVNASVSLKENILICDDIKSPFILGIIKPLIYVPSSIKDDTLELIIKHETAHIKRCDHLWKPLGFLLLSIYWFNPLVWMAYIFLCKDIEIACDEKVIKKLDANGRAEYSRALLQCSSPKKLVTACPVAFGEVAVKDRVKTILNYKRPAFWIVAISVILCVVLACCFLTDPKKEEPQKSYTFNIDCLYTVVSDANIPGYEDVTNNSLLPYLLMEPYSYPNIKEVRIEIHYSDAIEEHFGVYGAESINLKNKIENGPNYCIFPLTTLRRADKSWIRDDVIAMADIYVDGKLYETQAVGIIFNSNEDFVWHQQAHIDKYQDENYEVQDINNIYVGYLNKCDTLSEEINIPQSAEIGKGTLTCDIGISNDIELAVYRFIANEIEKSSEGELYIKTLLFPTWK